VIAGGSVQVKPQGVAQVQWQVENGKYAGGFVRADSDLLPGDTVLVRARAGNETREILLRVVDPVRWRWQTGGWQDPTRLLLQPAWRITPKTGEEMTLQFSATDGWRVSPPSLSVQGRKLPAQIALQVEKDPAAPAEAVLNITLRNGITPYRTALRLRMVETQPVLADLNNAVEQWGIARRGEQEIPDPGGTGAVYHTGDLPVGGVVKKGIFMHPPYIGGVGYAWAELKPISLPRLPCRFHSFIGIRDGGNPSDGVWFRLELIDAQGKVHRLAEGVGVQGSWRELEADLSPFAGQTVRLRLIADVGPNDDSTADWASWGEPKVMLATAVDQLMVSNEKDTKR
jgi:hypothetical protein